MTEIRISKKQLLDCLLRLRKGFCAKSALPILSDYKFLVDGNRMTISVYNGNSLWMIESFMIPDAFITYDGIPWRSWCVNRYNIVPALRSLEDQNIILKVFDYQMSVSHSCGSFSMPIDDGNAYLAFGFKLTDKNGHDCSTNLKLEVPGVLHWLKILRPSLGVDYLRPVLNGVAFCLSPVGLELAATDGHKLTRIRKQSIRGDRKDIIIPREAINILLDVLPKTGDIDFTFTNEKEGTPTARIVFDIDSDTEHTLQLWFKGIDGRYPDYNRVIPDSYPFSVSFNRRMMINCLKRAKVFCNCCSQLVKFGIHKDMIEFTTEDKDFSLSSCDIIPCESRCGDFLSQTIGAKITTVLDPINRLTTNDILLHFTDPSRAIIIEPEPQPEIENITILIMPMIIND